MKRFLKKMCGLFLLFVGVHVLLICGVPADHNQYLREYNHKVELLERTPSPRLIFMGGSNTAFALDSKTIGDSLHCRVVNFGLHGGIGSRYPVEDALQYVRMGDLVVFQIEYDAFFEETCNKETMPKLMTATGWRNVGQLTMSEWEAVLAGLPMLALSHLKRLLLYPVRHSFDTPQPERGQFSYVASGFNDYGDEVSHWCCNGGAYHPTAKRETRPVRQDFVQWLADVLKAYEEKGARVLMMPPACTSSCLGSSYSDAIGQALASIGYPYQLAPEVMTVPDNLAFNTGYHLNHEGVKLVTARIIGFLNKFW